MEVPILAAILEDVLSHTATVLGGLMAGKRCLTGGGITGDIYDSFFCLPVSQYIAIWNAGTIELWACDPNVDALLNNISQAKEIFDRTDQLKNRLKWCKFKATSQQPLGGGFLCPDSFLSASTKNILFNFHCDTVPGVL